MKVLMKVLKIIGILILLALLNAFLTRSLNPYFYQILILIGVNSILAVSLNLINGFTGQFSIGHAGFMALGGYTSAAICFYWGPAITESFTSLVGQTVAGWLLFPIGLLSGGCLAALSGFLVGIPALRLRGDYLAIVTLGFGEIIRVSILNLEFVGGSRGFADIAPYSNFFWVFLIVVGCVITVSHLVRSTRGQAFLAIREDEMAAEAIGIDTTRFKVIAFVIGAFFAGLAGALFAHVITYLHTNSFTFMRSIEVVVMVVLGGMGSITGSIVAATVLTILPEALRPVKEFRMVLYSILLIVLMLTRPQGIFGTGEICMKEWIGRILGQVRQQS